ncbi:MAG TPA: hypothetical protein VIJ39_11440 [Solirubrobacteraceae bacterium]
MAGADEAEQTSQAAAQTPQTAGQPVQALEQAPRASNEAAPTSEQHPAGANHGTDNGTQDAGQQAPESESAAEQQAPGFGERGRMRRRARFLRKARELAYRDLGGLVFDLHRFGQRNDQLVLAKLAMLRQIDSEVRELEGVLHDRRPITVLREVGIAACPRCAAIHGSDDRFCPGCGLAFDTNADRLISTAPVSPQARASASQSPPAQSQPSAQSPPPVQSQPSAQSSPPAQNQPSAQGSPPVQSPPPAQSQPSAQSSPPVQSPSPAPRVEPAPPLKPAASPLADNPAVRAPSPERREPTRSDEDEPTRILRPPSGGEGA